MRRVYAIWFVKKIASPAVVKFGIVLACLFQLKESVSLRMVIANSPSLTDIGHQMQFISGAFGHASISVQVLSISITIFALSLIFDLFRSYSFFDSKIRGNWSNVTSSERA